MNAVTLDVSQEQAAEALRLYREHKHAEPSQADREIERIYRQIARGKIVIQALESIRQAGLNEDGLPRLAIIRADSAACYLNCEHDNVVFSSGRFRRGVRVEVPWPGFQARAWSGSARVPYIPLRLRPKAELDNYHILWEADWHLIIPKDPMLLKRIGTDAWVVLAAWDLTPIELSVLNARVLAGKDPLPQ